MSCQPHRVTSGQKVKGTDLHNTNRLSTRQPFCTQIQYWPSGENIRKAQNVDVGRRNYGTITNLTESVLYQLRVFGYSRGGQGERSSPSVYFTVGGRASHLCVFACVFLLLSSLLCVFFSNSGLVQAVCV